MSTGTRTVVASLALLGVAAALVIAMIDLPGAGEYVGPYGQLLASLAVTEGRGSNAVTAVLFDLRPLDTLGEALALFVASAGLQLVLRHVPGQQQREVPLSSLQSRRLPPRSDAIRAVTLGFVAPTGALAIFLTLRGHLSVGGGLQGGALAATALALLFLAGRYRAQRSIASDTLLDVAEAVSLAGYVTVGMAGLAVGAAFLENVLPLGAAGTLLSAGTIPVLSALIALEAAAAVLLVVAEIQEEPIEMEGQP